MPTISVLEADVNENGIAWKQGECLVPERGEACLARAARELGEGGITAMEVNLIL